MAIGFAQGNRLGVYFYFVPQRNTAILVINSYSPTCVS
jgi:hypothetical protein